MNGTMFKVVFGILLTFSGLQLAQAATLIQQQAGVFAFEAEDYSSLTGSNWSLITTTSGLKTLPDGSNANGSALYAHNGGNPNSFATYDLQFTSSGTYYIYTKYSMYDRATSVPPSYGNEDSFYLPRDFSIAAAVGGGADVDWFSQHIPSNGNSPDNNPNEGMFFYWDEGQLSGTSTAPLTFTITGASEATPVNVTFTVGNREGGVALDRFIFSTTRLNSSITSGNSTTLDGIASVPEPSRAVLLLAGGMMALLGRRRRS